MANTILVVEDELSLRKALVEKLSHEDYQTIEAKDGQEGIESAKRDHPDLIILDVVMPGINGLDVLKSLKRNPVLYQVPVIILTNLAEENVQQEAKQLGASECLVKSNISLEEIIETVKNHLAKLPKNSHKEAIDEGKTHK